MRKWKQLFTVTPEEVEIIEQTGSFLFRTTRKKKVQKWMVKYKDTGQIVGAYDDLKYAISRARYKFKRYMKQAETILLG